MAIGCPFDSVYLQVLTNAALTHDTKFADERPGQGKGRRYSMAWSEMLRRTGRDMDPIGATPQARQRGRLSGSRVYRRCGGAVCYAFFVFQQTLIKENLVYAFGQFSRSKSQRRMKQLGRTLPFQLRAGPFTSFALMK